MIPSIEMLMAENKKLRKSLENIKSGGDWLRELEQEQDPSFPLMPLAYAKDCYRISKKALA